MAVFPLPSFFVAVIACLIAISDAFAPATRITLDRCTAPSSSFTSLHAIASADPSSLFETTMNTMPISAATVDPTTFLSDILAGLVGTPAILLVPVLAAVGVASTIAYLIVAYASPAEPDE